MPARYESAHIAFPLAGRQVPPQWPSPLADAMPEILARRGSPVCVLASGDQFFYGVGTLLSAHVGPQVVAASVILQIHMSGANIIATDRRPLA
jgi:precorrin-6B methylase 1